ncbi:MAG TPA: hypothetical protein VHC71_00105, partial [Hyphomicrobium sp.]|nr:hypothetical protein [Hyphomicrobium sp.]
AGLSGLSGAPLLDARPSNKEKLAVIAAKDAGNTVLWIANLTADEIVAEIPVMANRSARIALMDADAFERLTTTPDFLEFAGIEMPGANLILDAYAVAWIKIN